MRDRIEAEAADWLAKLEAGNADGDAFERWRSASTAHAAAFAQLDEAWSRLDRARALRPPGPPNAELLASHAERSTAPSRRRLLQAAMFGGLAIVGGGGVAAFLLSGRAYAETGIGERRAVRLPDGSLLDLNTNSRAEWQFSDRMRQVWLERGEAALEVASDREGRPFVITAAGRDIALGAGVFNARIKGDAAEFVALRDSAAPSDGASTIAEGERMLISDRGQQIAVLDSSETDAVGAWRRGEIIFDGDTLAAAVAEYNRYLTHPIAIEDNDLAQLRLGGRFTTQDPAAFLAAAQTAFGVRVVESSDGRTLITQ